MVDPTLLVAVIGSVAVLGYISNMIFEKTRIPDAVWLILFGVVIAWLGALPASGLLIFAPVLATLAVAVMGFEFGLHSDIHMFIRILPRTALLAVVTMVFSMLGVAIISNLFFGIDFLRALLLGAIVSNISSTPVNELLYSIRMKEDFRNVMQLESDLSDVLCFTVSVVLIGVYTLAGAVNPFQTIGAGFLVGIVVGGAIGAIRLAVSKYTKGKPYNYVLTLGMALVAFAATEMISGIGTIGAIVYGLMLANAKRLPHKAAILKDYKASSFMKKFYSEISLFLRAFFFIMLGTLALGVLNGDWWLGIVILVALLILRVPAVELAMLKKSATKQEKWLMKGMIPKDLSTVVLVMLAASKGIAGTESWLGIVFVVVLGSVLYATIMANYIMRKQFLTRISKPVNYEELPKRKLWKKYGLGK